MDAGLVAAVVVVLARAETVRLPLIVAVAQRLPDAALLRGVNGEPLIATNARLLSVLLSNVLRLIVRAPTRRQPDGVDLSVPRLSVPRMTAVTRADLMPAVHALRRLVLTGVRLAWAHRAKKRRTALLHLGRPMEHHGPRYVRQSAVRTAQVVQRGSLDPLATARLVGNPPALALALGLALCQEAAHIVQRNAAGAA